MLRVVRKHEKLLIPTFNFPRRRRVLFQFRPERRHALQIRILVRRLVDAFFFRFCFGVREDW